MAAWEEANAQGEMPGDICCQRAAGGRCYEHTPPDGRPAGDLIVDRVAKMLETASGADWQVKWARVNRAAGMIVAVCANEAEGMEAAAARAQAYLVRIAGTANLRISLYMTMISGLEKRVARGLAEWYRDGVSR